MLHVVESMLWYDLWSVVLIESFETQLPYGTEVLVHGEVKVPLRTIETSQTLLVRRLTVVKKLLSSNPFSTSLSLSLSLLGFLLSAYVC